MRCLGNIILCGFLFMHSLNLHSETIPAIRLKNTLVDVYYNLSGDTSITGKTWQEVCSAIGLPPTNTPGGYWCVNRAGNPVYVATNYICADGSVGHYPESALCPIPIYTCPDGWTLSKEKTICSRPDFSCIINTDLVSEEKLLAAIAYGEASTLDNYEEMAGIAYATIRRRDAAHKFSVNALIKKYKSFSYVISDGNERYRKLMCSESTEPFEKAFIAAQNALNKGIDYANGGCFWDGYDLKTSGKKHDKYERGFQYSDPSHNIFSAPEPPPVLKKGQNSYFYNTYISTAAHGRTIFWKLDKQFLKAKGALQCR